jgi:hypothetical protein
LEDRISLSYSGTGPRFRPGDSMKQLITVTVSAVLLASSAAAQSTSANRIGLVQDFIRGLGVSHEITEAFKAQSANQNGGGTPLSRPSTLLSRKAGSLGTSVAALNSIHLEPPDDALVQGLIKLYQQDKSLYEEVAGISEAVSPPANAANIDRDSVLILQIDHVILNLTPAVFSILVDKQGVAPGHMGRLFITKAQRQQLVDQLEMTFGLNPDASDPTGVPAAAIFLKSSLQKDFLATDE